MKLETYCLYEIIGYEVYVTETDSFKNANVINVIADNEADAVKRAGEILVKPFYKIKSVTEYLVPAK